MFGRALEKQVPKHYWKSEVQKKLTFKELLEVNRNLPKAKIGLASTTIARHLTTITNIIQFADRENNKASFILTCVLGDDQHGHHPSANRQQSGDCPLPDRVMRSIIPKGEERVLGQNPVDFVHEFQRL